MSSKIELLVPEGLVKSSPLNLAPRIAGLKGKVIGFMGNGKPNADVLLARLAHLLEGEYELAGIRSRHKPRVTEPATFIEDLAKESQAVVNAIGD